jgi:single-strand DNA-binding protein
MNKITATGRLAADSELRFTPKGDPILNFRLASDVGFGDNKTTNWFACSLFGRRGEALQPHLLKGQQVTVFGTLTLREWTGKDGGKQLSPDIRIDEVELQGGAKAGGQQRPAAQEQQFSTPDNFVADDIPF